MDDIAPELYERLKAEYERRRGSAADAAEKAKGYRDVLSWADHAGRSAALTFDGILPEELPDGMMYFNIAERTLRPVLEEVAADVLTVAKAAQETLNAAAGIEMAFQAPDEEDKIKGLVDLACAGPWDAQQDDFCAATQTYASKVSDDCIWQNAGSQYDAGMDPKIIRTAGAGACVWCASLAGTYDYEKVRRGSEVFSRHVNCNCVVEYEPRKGRRQDVHSKRWNDADKKPPRQIIENERIRIPQLPASIMTERVRSGRYNLKLTSGGYRKHVEGTKEYRDYLESRRKKGIGPQGVLTISREETQAIIREKTGTGIIKTTKDGEPLHIEKITCDRVVGKYFQKGKWYDTNKAEIRYGKDGSHLVPIKGLSYD